MCSKPKNKATPATLVLCPIRSQAISLYFFWRFIQYCMPPKAAVAAAVKKAMDNQLPKAPRPIFSCSSIGSSPTNKARTTDSRKPRVKLNRTRLADSAFSLGTSIELSYRNVTSVAPMLTTAKNNASSPKSLGEYKRVSSGVTAMVTPCAISVPTVKMATSRAALPCWKRDFSLVKSI